MLHTQNSLWSVQKSEEELCGNSLEILAIQKSGELRYSLSFIYSIRISHKTRKFFEKIQKSFVGFY